MTNQDLFEDLLRCPKCLALVLVEYANWHMHAQHDSHDTIDNVISLKTGRITSKRWPEEEE